MSLAYLARLYPNELICDMAETYHVYDWRALPGRLAATLAAGLRQDSRVKTKVSGFSVSLDTMLAANIADCLRILVWRESRDGLKGVNPPVMFTELLSNESANENEQGFESPEDFIAWRNRMLGGEDNGV